MVVMASPSLAAKLVGRCRSDRGEGTHREGAHAHHRWRGGREGERPSRQLVEVRQVLDDVDAGGEQRGVDRPRRLTAEDLLIVAPYNAQVSDLLGRLPGMRVGTVDKFQGQEAPVVIYSMTTSSPEDAPRGMEFLFSLNRLNVATSRAMSAVILVGSPKLFEPECRSPRQMQLANALCAYREMATEVDPAAI